MKDLAAVGYDHPRIAARIGISVPTLYEYYRKELDFGEMDLLCMATRGLAEALRKRKPWAICFVLKTKGKSMGWTERAEITGKDGAPLFDLSKLSDRELADLEEIVGKTAPASATVH